MEFPVKLGRNETSNQQSQELDCTTGNLEVLSAQSIETEGANNDGSELFFVRIPFPAVPDNNYSNGWEKHTLVKAEFGTCAPTAIINKSQVFGSLAACQT